MNEYNQDSMNQLVLLEEEFADNPNTRVPVILCLDTSYSMSDEPIQELNEGVSIIQQDLMNDSTARFSAEICVITYGGSPQVIVDYALVDNLNIPLLQADGCTPMGAAVHLALDQAEARKNEYKANGISYWQPWLFLLTDGCPTDDIESAVSRTAQLVQAKKLSIFPIGIGPYADLDVLARFSPNRQPLRIKDGRMKDFFEWLSKSVSTASGSTPGQNPQLGDPTGWGQTY